MALISVVLNTRKHTDDRRVPMDPATMPYVSPQWTISFVALVPGAGPAPGILRGYNITILDHSLMQLIARCHCPHQPRRRDIMSAFENTIEEMEVSYHCTTGSAKISVQHSIHCPNLDYSRRTGSHHAPHHSALNDVSHCMLHFSVR